MICCYLEALTRTLGKDLPEIVIFDTTLIIGVIYIITLA